MPGAQLTREEIDLSIAIGEKATTFPSGEISAYPSEPAQSVSA